MATSSTDPRSSVGFAQVGGPGRGGAVFATPQTQWSDQGIPQFLDALVEPYVKQKSLEMVFKGATDQMTAMANGEVIDSEAPSSRLFGPTNYEQGAAHYRANTLLQTQMQDWLNDDKLKELRPEDLAKHMASTAQSMLTGNSATDALLQKGLMEGMSSVVGTVAKKRFAWQQENGIRSTVENRVANFETYHDTVTQLAGVTDPNDKNTAAEAAVNNLLGSLPPVAGQLGESWRSANKMGVIQALERGKGFAAVDAIRKAGLFHQMFDEKDIPAIEAAYDKYAAKANDAAMVVLEPQVQSLIKDIGTGAISIEQKTQRMFDLNKRASEITGIDPDQGQAMYSPKEIIKAGGDLIAVMIADARAGQARALALSDKQAEADAAVANMGRAVATGQVTSFLANKVITPEQANMTFGGLWTSGSTREIVRANQNGGYMAESVQKLAQSQVKSAIGDSYNPTFAAAHRRWAEVNDMSPATALAIYGDDITNQMRVFDSMTKGPAGSDPAIAFRDAFNPMRSVTLAAKDRKTVGTAISDSLGDFRGSDVVKLAPSAEAMLVDAVSGYVAGDRSGMGKDVLTKNKLKVLLDSGQYEVGGPLAWHNPKGQPTLLSITHMKPKEFDDIFRNVLDAELKGVGFKAGAKGDNYTVIRMPDSNGKGVLSVMALDNEGAPHMVVIDTDDLNSAMKDRVGFIAGGGLLGAYDRYTREKRAKFVADAKAKGLKTDGTIGF